MTAAMRVVRQAGCRWHGYRGKLSIGDGHAATRWVQVARASWQAGVSDGCVSALSARVMRRARKTGIAARFEALPDN